MLCPTELVKIRIQGNNDVTEANEKKPSVCRVIRNIYKTDGLKGLFRGLRSTIARESVGCSIFFGSYEWTREKLKPVGKKKEDCDAGATLTAGAVAGLFMWSVVYPIDVLKSRVQMSEGVGEISLIKKEIRNVGLRGLYCGLWPTLVKTIPVTAVSIKKIKKYN